MRDLQTRDGTQIRENGFARSWKERAGSRGTFQVMSTNFRFRIQPTGTKRQRRFHVRIGMEGDAINDYIPAHRSAFAKLLVLQSEHDHESEAEREARRLREFLDAREKALPPERALGS